MANTVLEQLQEDLAKSQRRVRRLEQLPSNLGKAKKRYQKALGEALTENWQLQEDIKTLRAKNELLEASYEYSNVRGGRQLIELTTLRSRLRAMKECLQAFDDGLCDLFDVNIDIGREFPEPIKIIGTIIELREKVGITKILADTLPAGDAEKENAYKMPKLRQGWPYRPLVDDKNSSSAKVAEGVTEPSDPKQAVPSDDGGELKHFVYGQMLSEDADRIWNYIYNYKYGKYYWECPMDEWFEIIKLLKPTNVGKTGSQLVDDGSDLKPCPSCGQLGLLIHGEDSQWLEKYVECPKCGVRGPRKENTQAAREGWDVMPRSHVFAPLVEADHKLAERVRAGDYVEKRDSQVVLDLTIPEHTAIKNAMILDKRVRKLIDNGHRIWLKQPRKSMEQEKVDVRPITSVEELMKWGRILLGDNA